MAVIIGLNKKRNTEVLLIESYYVKGVPCHLVRERNPSTNETTEYVVPSHDVKLLTIGGYKI